MKKILLIGLLASPIFSFAASNVAANRTIDFHTMQDPGSYGLPESSTYLNAPSQSIKYPASAFITKGWEDNNTYNIQQSIHFADGTIWTEWWNSEKKTWSNWVQTSGGGSQKCSAEHSNQGMQVQIQTNTTGISINNHNLSITNVNNTTSNDEHNNIQPTYYVQNIFIFCV